MEITAETIDESLARLFAPDPTDQKLRAAAWREAFATDASAATDIGTILAHGPYSEAELRLRLEQIEQDPAPAAAGPADGWSLRFAELFADLHTTATAVPDPEIAFARLLQPLVDRAVERLARLPGANDAVRAAFGEWLLHRVSRLLGPTLFERFAIFRHRVETEGVATAPDGSTTPRAELPGEQPLFAFFDAQMASIGWLPFFQNRPVLARALTRLVGNWEAATGEVLQRFDSDRARIEAEFFDGSALGPITAIDCGLSDPHRGGRSVVRLHFAHERRLVYKPRSLATDLAWAEFLRWAAEHGLAHGLVVARSLDRGSYGWQGHIAQRKLDAAHGEQACEFYLRAGTALALFHLLGTSDIHMENLIAVGDRPAFIDLETLLQPQFHATASMRADQRLVALCWNRLHETVTGSLLLPMTLPESGEAFAVGGLSEQPGSTALGWCYQGVNTDGMQMHQQAETMPPGHNLPEGPNGPIGAAAFGDALIAGFEQTCAWATEACSIGDLRQRFAGLELRMVPRATGSYASMLHLLRDPRRVRNGIYWSARLSWLVNEQPRFRQPHLHGMLAAERRQLSELDIPYFTVPADGADLSDHNGLVAAGAFDPALAQVARRLVSLGDRMAQDFDRSTIEVLLAAEDFALPPRPEAGALPATEALFDRADAAADAIAAQLRQAAIVEGRQATWVGIRPYDINGSSFTAIRDLALDVYDGTLGIALFLAAWSHVREQDDGTRELVRSVLRHASARIAAGAEILPGPGIGSGIGGAIYAGVTIDRPLGGEPLAMALADEAAQVLLARPIAEDAVPDILAGLAGAAAALLALHAVRPRPELLDGAVRYAERLQQLHLDGGDSDARWWPMQGRAPMSGFAHGLSGIEVALRRVGQAASRPDLLALADATRDEIRNFYDPARNGWIAERATPDEAPVCRWCHGGVGIGAGRRDLDRTPSAERTAAIAQAVASQNHVDWICCGEAGTIGFLLGEGDAGDAPRRDAYRRIVSILDGAASRGAFLHGGGGDAVHLSLFRGIAGIGWQMLSARPGRRLPDLLAFGD